MARCFSDDCLIIASHNAGKVREIDFLLQPFGVTTLSAGELGLPEPEETGDTFTANAVLKAEAAAMAAANGEPRGGGGCSSSRPTNSSARPTSIG